MLALAVYIYYCNVEVSSTEINPELRSEAELVETWLDDVRLLAGKAACWYAEHEYQRPLPHDMFEELDDLNNDIDDLSHLEVTFSGEGCVPVMLPNGEPATVYGQADLLRGTLQGVDFSDSVGLDFTYERELADFEHDIDDDGDILYDSQSLAHIRGIMRQPPRGLRPFVDILLHSDDSVSEFAGTSFRARGIDTFATMDGSTLRILQVDDAPELLPADELGDVLQMEARDMYNLLRDTAFRRKTLSSQQQTIDRRVSKLNKKYRPERYQVFIDTDDLYVPDTAYDNHRMKHVSLDESASGFQADLVQIDVIDHFTLTGGRRLINNKRMLDDSIGFCLVAQVDEITREWLGLEKDIVWVPIRPKLNEARGRARKLGRLTTDVIFYEKPFLA